MSGESTRKVSFSVASSKQHKSIAVESRTHKKIFSDSISAEPHSGNRKRKSKEVIIPLPKKTNTSILPKSQAKTLNTDDKKCDDLADKAIGEIIKQSQAALENWESRPADGSVGRAGTSVIPMATVSADEGAANESLPTSKAVAPPAVELADDADYSQVDVADFGLASLRGMGWRPEDEKKSKKKSKGTDDRDVATGLPSMRPKGLGLGAMPPSFAPRTSGRDSRQEKEGLDEKGAPLVWRRGATCQVLPGAAHRRAGFYATVLSLDGDLGRVTLQFCQPLSSDGGGGGGGDGDSWKRPLSTDDVAALPEQLLRLVNRTEFKHFSKYLNKAKVDEYKRQQAEIESHHQEQQRRDSDVRQAVSPRSASRHDDDNVATDADESSDTSYRHRKTDRRDDNRHHRRRDERKVVKEEKQVDVEARKSKRNVHERPRVGGRSGSSDKEVGRQHRDHCREKHREERRRHYLHDDDVSSSNDAVRRPRGRSSSRSPSPSTTRLAASPSSGERPSRRKTSPRVAADSTLERPLHREVARPDSRDDVDSGARSNTRPSSVAMDTTWLRRGLLVRIDPPFSSSSSVADGMRGCLASVADVASPSECQLRLLPDATSSGVSSSRSQTPLCLVSSRWLRPVPPIAGAAGTDCRGSTVALVTLSSTSRSSSTPTNSSITPAAPGSLARIVSMDVSGGRCVIQLLPRQGTAAAAAVAALHTTTEILTVPSDQLCLMATTIDRSGICATHDDGDDDDDLPVFVTE